MNTVDLSDEKVKGESSNAFCLLKSIFDPFLASGYSSVDILLWIFFCGYS